MPATSKLEPHRKLILELRERNNSLQRIVDILRDKHKLKTSVGALYNFLIVRLAESTGIRSSVLNPIPQKSKPPSAAVPVRAPAPTPAPIASKGKGSKPSATKQLRKPGPDLSLAPEADSLTNPFFVHRPSKPSK